MDQVPRRFLDQAFTPNLPLRKTSAPFIKLEILPRRVPMADESRESRWVGKSAIFHYQVESLCSSVFLVFYLQR